MTNNEKQLFLLALIDNYISYKLYTKSENTTEQTLELEKQYLGKYRVLADLFQNIFKYSPYSVTTAAFNSYYMQHDKNYMCWLADYVIKIAPTIKRRAKKNARLERNCTTYRN